MYINYILFLQDNFVNALGNNVKIVINKTINFCKVARWFLGRSFMDYAEPLSSLPLYQPYR